MHDRNPTTLQSADHSFGASDRWHFSLHHKRTHNSFTRSQNNTRNRRLAMTYRWRRPSWSTKWTMRPRRIGPICIYCLEYLWEIRRPPTQSAASPFGWARSVWRSRSIVRASPSASSMLAIACCVLAEELFFARASWNCRSNLSVCLCSLFVRGSFNLSLVLNVA